MDVSIILVNYNTKDLTRNCLKSIYEKVSGLEFEVWVTDNGSIDGSCEMIKNEFPQVNLIEAGENLGFGRANNLAIQQSNAKYVLLLNTDTVLINNAPKIFFDFMEQNPKAAVCGGNLYNENNEHVHSYGHLPTLKEKCINTFQLTAFYPRIKQKIRDKGNNENNEFKQVDQIIGADMFVRKSVFDEVGYFDPEFFLYFEESELQFRIKQEGWHAYILPDAEIYHFEGKSTKKKKAKTEAKLKSEYLFYKKCYKLKKLSPYKLVFMLSHIVRLFVTPLLILKVWLYIIKS